MPTFTKLMLVAAPGAMGPNTSCVFTSLGGMPTGDQLFGSPH